MCAVGFEVVSGEGEDSERGVEVAERTWRGGLGGGLQHCGARRSGLDEMGEGACARVCVCGCRNEAASPKGYVCREWRPFSPIKPWDPALGGRAAPPLSC
jgi:hypothetical protein